jgi:hypothetical protein
VKNTRLINPKTGTFVFGLIEIPKQSRWNTIPGGEIFLLQGRHIAVNKGYGVEHIWTAHENEMRSAGFSSKVDVPAYVSRIIHAGAGVHCEFSQIRQDQKLTVVRSPHGTAVLELRRPRNPNENPFYSILTAYSKNNANGTRVGTVR